MAKSFRGDEVQVAAEDDARRLDDQRIKAENEPSNLLAQAYADYIVTKRCHERRDGNTTVWINNVEMDRGRTEIATIETRLKAASASPMNTDVVWALANKSADTATVLDIETCHPALSAHHRFRTSTGSANWRRGGNLFEVRVGLFSLSARRRFQEAGVGCCNDEEGLLLSPAERWL